MRATKVQRRMGKMNAKRVKKREKERKGRKGWGGLIDQRAECNWIDVSNLLRYAESKEFLSFDGSDTRARSRSVLLATSIVRCAGSTARLAQSWAEPRKKKGLARAKERQWTPVSDGSTLIECATPDVTNRANIRKDQAQEIQRQGTNTKRRLVQTREEPNTRQKPQAHLLQNGLGEAKTCLVYGGS